MKVAGWSSSSVCTVSYTILTTLISVLTPISPWSSSTVKFDAASLTTNSKGSAPFSTVISKSLRDTSVVVSWSEISVVSLCTTYASIAVAPSSFGSGTKLKLTDVGLSVPTGKAKYVPTGNPVGLETVSKGSPLVSLSVPLMEALSANWR